MSPTVLKLARFFVAGILVLLCAALRGEMAQSSSQSGGSGDDWPTIRPESMCPPGNEEG